MHRLRIALDQEIERGGHGQSQQPTEEQRPPEGDAGGLSAPDSADKPLKINGISFHGKSMGDLLEIYGKSMGSTANGNMYGAYLGYNMDVMGDERNILGDGIPFPY